MRNKMYQSSQFVIGIIEKMMANAITFSGEEHLDKNHPTLFVANHFTRIETFLVPYMLYKKMNFKVRSLADNSIFQGILGDYLSAVGTVSTKDPQRNEKILGDLLTAKENWMIYPEGSMIKSKKILLSDKSFLIENSEGLQNIYTGSAVLALQSELEKSRYFEALNRCEIETLREFRSTYLLDSLEEISYHNTHIIPVNISYNPITKGKNSLLKFVSSHIKSDSTRVKEEIELESNILLNSQLHVHFSAPIDVKAFLLKAKKEYYQKHQHAPNADEILEEAKLELTNTMMSAVYRNIQLNFNHIFALTLEYMKESTFSLHVIKYRMYLNVKELICLETYHLDKSIKKDFYTLLNDEEHLLFESAINRALEENILYKKGDDSYAIDKEVFQNQHTFHSIRIKNIFRVLLNETAILSELHNSIEKQSKKDINQVYEEVFRTIYQQDENAFKHDYNNFYSVFDSKDKEIGKPFILFDAKNSIGCVLSHGYKSAPKEVALLAAYLFSQGINVYVIRLKGHGTMPEDLRDASYQDWSNSFDIGYAALRGVSKKLFVCGFSTGGLVALLKASKVHQRIDGVICINTAISLQDIRVKYIVPTLNVLNNLLSVFHADYDTYESEPEHPEINYKKHYLTSIGELKKLIDITNENLKKVITPTLIIQADKDPIVNPQSANIIYEGIASEYKEKCLIRSDKHVIVLEKEKKEEVFEKIKAFIYLISAQ